jgi:tetratricopeptide (TPR) repeat protein
MDATARQLMTQLRQNPLDFGALDALRQHCQTTRSFSVWAEALEHHARAATDADGDPVELGRLHYELGNLYRDQLERPELALEHYRSAFDFDAAQRPAIVAARAIVTQIGDYEQVAELLTREAESLPSGPKRAAAWVELASIYKSRLNDREEAEQALREAISADAKDLHVQHELATLLLEDADQASDKAVAEQKRRDAADVLTRMAGAVSDDYAFAYIEAALDAVPDHQGSLALLEQVAPRMSRGDALAPRWLAAIRSTKDRKLARKLRLSMARAYVAVGQFADARICLDPLLAEQDAEAMEVERALRTSGRPNAADGQRSQRGASSPDEEVSAEEMLSSSELLLDESDDGDSLAAELARLEEAEPDDSARDPLADLAVLDRDKPSAAARRDAGPVASSNSSRSPELGDSERPARALRSDRDADRADGEQPAQAANSERPGRQLDGDKPARQARSDQRARDPQLDSSELAIANLGPYEPEQQEEPTTADGGGVLGARLADSDAPKSSARGERDSAAKSKSAPLKLPFDDDDVDPFAEETQPRAAPLTLAELTALTGGTQPRAPGLPDAAEEEQDVASEVTQITPAEDPQMTEVRSLRTELARRLRFRDRRGAAEVSETLLDRGVFDSEAIEALEEHYRLTRDFRRLRDLSLRIARETSFPAELRAARLREAVMLSESKLGDQDGAAVALRELLQLEPDDAEAFDKFKRLLTRGQRWDELAGLLEERANETAEPRAQAELLRLLGTIERDRRNAPERAIDALARARDIDPTHPEDDVALSELYLGAGRYAEAAEAFEARCANAEADELPNLLANLAKVYEEQLDDDEGALRALERWRALEPRKREPLDGIIRLLERRGAAQPLYEALVAKLALSPAAERGKLHVRIAELALTGLQDAARAADSYAEAIAATPQDRALWQAAAVAFERAGRSKELDSLLSSLAQGTRDRALQARLWGHLGETRAQQGDLAGAILAREAQLGASSDVSVLDALVSLLRQTDRVADLARRLDELARRSEPEGAHALRIERAALLAQKLRDPEGAKAELERVLAEIAPDDVQALRMLVDLCIATGDITRRASAQERLMKLAPSLSARVELAVELVDLYERDLGDSDGAVRVLSLWTTLEPQNPQPYLRLIPLLAQAGKRRELVEANDKLAGLAMTEEEAGEFVLRAARVAIELEDWDGAWNRLVPRVVESNDLAAETLLRELATAANRGEQLAAVYVGLAQRAEDPQRERQRWADAARAFEQHVGAPDRALEAMLRALAKQLDSEELLHEVERLSERANAWPRLAQVYDTLIRKAQNTSARIALLMRHAHLLETRAEDASAAFERVWLAFQLDPGRDVTYEQAKRLARLTERREELLSAYERRAQSNASVDARLDALLDGCALAQHGFEDPARATGYLSRAVTLAGSTDAQLDSIETRVRAIDEQQPLIHGRGLLAELAGVYATLASEHTKNPELASAWLARAARIQEHTLEDPGAAYRVLERASALAPSEDKLFDELHRVAGLAGKWEALAAHLQHTADVAIDSRSSSAALSRLGALYERELASPTRAADAYEQLVRLRPQDADASQRLRQCLRAAERFEELLIAIDRELFMLKPEQGKKDLLKQAAETWEFGLKNRYEALDAWRKVAAVAPQDPEAVAALARLRSRPRADDSLLDGDLVVLPEDLRPSIVGPPVDESLFTSTEASEPQPVASLFGEPSGDRDSAHAHGVEPERVTHEDLSMLSAELATRRSAARQQNGVQAAEAERTTSPGFGDDELGFDEDDHDLASNRHADFGAREEELDQPDGDFDASELLDDEDDRLRSVASESEPDFESLSASREIDAELLHDPERANEFDADVTIPLEPRAKEDDPPLVSLEGLSSLVERKGERRSRNTSAASKHKKGPNGRKR